MRKSQRTPQHGTQNVKTFDRTTQKTKKIRITLEHKLTSLILGILRIVAILPCLVNTGLMKYITMHCSIDNSHPYTHMRNIYIQNHHSDTKQPIILFFVILQFFYITIVFFWISTSTLIPSCHAEVIRSVFISITRYLFGILYLSLK